MSSGLTAALAALLLSGSVAAASTAPIVLQNQPTVWQQHDDRSGRTVLPLTLEERRAFERAKGDQVR